jgi:carbamoyl-phosphate synthase small subunit
VVGPQDGPLIAAIDTGIKASIIRHLVQRGARVALHPCDVSATTLLESDPDAVFLANGPGDPSALDYIVGQRERRDRQEAVWGICLGHQLLSRAVGLETFKLPFGHRGANHPVKDVETGASRSRARTTASRSSARAARTRSPSTSRCASRPTSAPRSSAA